MTEPTAPVSLDDPRVQARVGEKAQAYQEAMAAHEKALMAGPQTVGQWTFHPPNSCTFDAIAQPALLELSELRLRYILGYLLTLEPANQIAASADVTALRQAAAQWQDQIPAADLPRIVQITGGALAWLQNRMTRDTAFFFAQ